MTNDNDHGEGRDGVTVERDHPQTRKGESDARGSAEWNEDVIDPDDTGKRKEQRGDSLDGDNPSAG